MNDEEQIGLKINIDNFEEAYSAVCRFSDKLKSLKDSDLVSKEQKDQIESTIHLLDKLKDARDRAIEVDDKATKTGFIDIQSIELAIKRLRELYSLINSNIGRQVNDERGLGSAVHKMTQELKARVDYARGKPIDKYEPETQRAVGFTDQDLEYTKEKQAREEGKTVEQIQRQNERVAKQLALYNDINTAANNRLQTEKAITAEKDKQNEAEEAMAIYDKEFAPTREKANYEDMSKEFDKNPNLVSPGSSDVKPEFDNKGNTINNNIEENIKNREVTEKNTEEIIALDTTIKEVKDDIKILKDKVWTIPPTNDSNGVIQENIDKTNAIPQEIETNNKEIALRESNLQELENKRKLLIEENALENQKQETVKQEQEVENKKEENLDKQEEVNKQEQDNIKQEEDNTQKAIDQETQKQEEKEAGKENTFNMNEASIKYAKDVLDEFGPSLGKKATNFKTELDIILKNILAQGENITTNTIKEFEKITTKLAQYFAIAPEELKKKLNDAMQELNNLQAKTNTTQQEKSDILQLRKQALERRDAINPDLDSQSQMNYKTYSKEIDEYDRKLKTLNETLGKQTANLQEARAEVNKYQEALKKKNKLEEAGKKMITEAAQARQTTIQAEREHTDIVRKGTDALKQQDTIVGKATKTFIKYRIVLNALKKLLREAITTVKEMDKALTSMTVVTGRSRQEALSYVSTFNKLAQATSTTMTDIAGLVTEFLRQGRSMADSLQLAEEAAKAAKIAGISASESIEYMTAAINGFNLAAEDATRVSDIFAALAAESATDYESLAIALSKVSAQANLAGMSIEYTTALLAKGIETTQEAPESIGTALKTVLARMKELSDYGKVLEEGTSVNNVEKSLKAAGIELRTTTGEFRDLSDIFDELGPKWDSLNSMVQQSIAQAVAGTR